MDKRATTTAGGGGTAKRMSFFAVFAIYKLPTIEKLNKPPPGLCLQKQQQYAIPFPHLLLRIAHRKNTR
jgi:hypothetical protein